MPGRRTVFDWLLVHEDFAINYAKARDFQIEGYMDEVIGIADDSSEDRIERTREDGSTYEVVDMDHINRMRLRIDTRKWIAGKMKAKKYGDRLALAGEDGAALMLKIDGSDKDG